MKYSVYTDKAADSCTIYPINDGESLPRERDLNQFAFVADSLEAAEQYRKEFHARSALAQSIVRKWKAAYNH